MAVPQDAKFENGQQQAESAAVASTMEQKRTDLVPVYKGGSVPVFMSQEALDNLKVEPIESC